MSNASQSLPAKPPKSLVHWWDPFLIAVVIVATYIYTYNMAFSTLELVLVLVGVLTAIMVPIEFWRSPMRKIARPALPFGQTLTSAAKKSVVIILLAGCVLTVWSLVYEYQRSEYKPLFEAMPYVLPTLPFVIFFWVLWTEWRLGPANDYVAALSDRLFHGRAITDWIDLRNSLMGWCVRGFFLPLNFTSAVFMIPRFRGHEASFMDKNWVEQVQFLDSIIFAMLIIAIIPGYCFSARILNTSVKKTDHSWFGWMVTLFCYPPINRGTGSGWFVYHIKETSQNWVTWFGTEGTAVIITGSALLVCYFVHYWAEAIFCLRSSHLTNRGIITNGPFRICKHPVYVSKCIAWFITFLPFLTYPNVILGNITITLGSFAFCLVYIGRGWVEERLLSTDPDYVAYALWMDKHSWFSFVGRHIPLMSFEYRLKRWNKHRETRPDDF